MSTTISIMYLIFGLILTILAFFPKSKWGNLSLMITVFLFLLTGIWDIINRNKDTKNDKEEIKTTISKSDTGTFKKIDDNAASVVKNNDSNSGVIITTVKEQKLKPIFVSPNIIVPKQNAPSNGNTQTIESGGSGIQNNNSPNYGQQAGRDINNINERKINDDDKAYLINFISKLTDTIPVKPKCFFMTTLPNTNGASIASQVTDFLISRGYELKAVGIQGMDPFYGMKVFIKGDCLHFIVGNMK